MKQIICRFKSWAGERSRLKIEVDWLNSLCSQIWNYTNFNQHSVWGDQHLFAYYFELNALDFHIRYLSVWCSVQCLIKSKISSKVDWFHGDGLVIINQLSALSSHNLLILYYPLKIHYRLKTWSTQEAWAECVHCRVSWFSSRRLFSHNGAATLPAKAPNLDIRSLAYFATTPATETDLKMICGY